MKRKRGRPLGSRSGPQTHERKLELHVLRVIAEPFDMHQVAEAMERAEPGLDVKLNGLSHSLSRLRDLGWLKLHAPGGPFLASRYVRGPKFRQRKPRNTRKPRNDLAVGTPVNPVDVAWREFRGQIDKEQAAA